MEFLATYSLQLFARVGTLFYGAAIAADDVELIDLWSMSRRQQNSEVWPNLKEYGRAIREP